MKISPLRRIEIICFRIVVSLTSYDGRTRYSNGKTAALIGPISSIANHRMKLFDDTSMM